MILVFFLITLLFLLILFTICIILSNLQIQITNFKLDNIQHLSPKYIINISLKLFNKIKWISINLDNYKIRKILNKVHLEKIDIKELEKNINLEEIKELINIKPKILSLDLNIDVGLENVILTSYLIPIICTIISMILSKLIDLRNIDNMDDIDDMDEINNIKYIVTPIYNRGNVYKIQLNTIVNFKITTAIKSMYRIYKINKKNKEERKNKEKENRKDKNNRKIKTGFNYSV